MVFGPPFKTQDKATIAAKFILRIFLT